mmetsp:Transcript_63816/g.157028  ORF Transcript_63816/g.157028 Transcript_63816/m.157028 type:complete len:235 (-) Transcript_63816:211-915(-)
MVPAQQHVDHRPKGPHVRLEAVPRVRVHLGRAVPHSPDVARVRADGAAPWGDLSLLLIVIILHPKPLPHAKVSQQQLVPILVCEEDVLGLEVSVDDALAVHVIQGCEEALGNVFRRLLRQRPRAHDPLQQVPPRCVLHHKASHALLLRNDVFVEFADALVRELPQHARLLECPLVALHDLDGNNLPRHPVRRLVDLPEGPAPAAADAPVVHVDDLGPRHDDGACLCHLGRLLHV